MPTDLGQQLCLVSVWPKAGQARGRRWWGTEALLLYTAGVGRRRGGERLCDDDGSPGTRSVSRWLVLRPPGVLR